MSDTARATIEPTQRDIEAWKLEAETAIRFGGVERLGRFNWPQAVLSLIAKLEKKIGADTEATHAAQGMKKPKYFAPTMQMQSDAGINPFALQLVAEAHADDKTRFGDETVVALARAHNGTPVFILISTRQPTPDQFKDWPA